MAELTIPSARGERLKADLTLLLVAFIWGTAFVAQRVAALNMEPFLFNGLRFLFGALVLVPFAYRRAVSRVGNSTPTGGGLANRRTTFWTALERKDIWKIALAGLLLFSGITFQQVGIRYTTASNAGFITGLYVVFIPFFLAVGWRKLPRPTVWIASLLAAAGLFLLSTGGQLRLAPGDLLELACALMWAFHVIWIGALVQRMDVLQLAIGQYVVCGGLSLGLSLLLEGDALPQAPVAWVAIIYTGIFSIGMGYTLQAVGQRHAPAADAAIILSLEAVFAAVAGWLLLGERLSALQFTGCGLMLAGMLLAQMQSYAWGKRE